MDYRGILAFLDNEIDSLGSGVLHIGPGSIEMCIA